MKRIFILVFFSCLVNSIIAQSTSLPLIVSDDIAIQSVLKRDYSQYPIAIKPIINFSASIKNKGTNAASTVELTVNVYNHSNALVYTTNSTSLLTLNAGVTTTVTTINSFSPTIADTYKLEYTISMTEVDLDMSNNTFIDSVVVSDSTYARDIGPAVGSLGIGSGNGGYLGQQYVLTHEVDLTSISMYMYQPKMNTKVSAAVFNYSNGKPVLNPTYTCTPITITSSTSNWYNFLVTPPISLLADTFFIAAVEIDSTLNVGQSTNIFRTSTTWVNWPTSPTGDWENNEVFGATFSRPYMLRAHVKESLPASIVNRDKEVKMVVLPNPNNGHFTLKVDGNWLENAELSIYNVLGRKVYSQVFKEIPQTHIDLHLNNQPAGIYYITVKTTEFYKTIPIYMN